MLVRVEMQVALGFLVFCPKNSVRRSELGHDQSTSAKVADEAPKDRIRNARHRSENRRRSNLDVADHDMVRHGSARTNDDARAYIPRIVPVLPHLAILPPSANYAAVAQFASHNYMDEIPRTFLPEPSPADAGKWIGRVVIAVILAEGIWGFIASITNNLILPSLARIMGADAQSPLYLGKGDFNVPALFTSVLELCFVAIAAVILNSWVRRKPQPIRSKSVRVSPIPAQPAAPADSPLSIAPIQAAVSVPPPPKAPVPPPAAVAPVIASPAAPASTPGQFWSPPEPSPQPKAAAVPPPPKTPAKPAKPKQPKEVYYNIVGEPINPTEDE
jgi:hypothetical protein